MFYFALKKNENHIQKHYLFLGMGYVVKVLNLLDNNTIPNTGIKNKKKVVVVILKIFNFYTL